MSVIRQDVVQITWDVEDSPLNKITKETNKFQGSVKKAVGNTEKGFGKMTKAVKTLDNEKLNKLNKSIDNVTKKIGTGLVGAAKKAGQVLAGIGMAAGSAAIGGAVIGVNYNAEMEKYQTSFEVMTGSANKAADVVSRLQKMGAATPFEMTDLANATQLLMNYGFTADDAINRMTMLGDIAQGDASKMERIAMAYGQMSSAGKVQLEDVKQMIEAGFNPLQEISQSTGESMASLYDRISDGSISVDEITESMKRSTSAGGKYFQSMEKQSKTFNGQLSTMKDNFNNLLGTITGGLSKKLAGTVMPKINDLIGKLTDAFNAGGFSGMFSTLLGELGPVGDKIQTVVDKVKAFVTNGEKMQIIKDTFGTIKDIAIQLGEWIGIAADKVWGFVTSTGFLNGVKTVIDGIASAFQWVKDHIDTVKWAIENFAVGLLTAYAAFKVITTAITIYNGVMKVIQVVQGIAAAAQMGFNAALWACPITWIVAAIVALIVIVVLLVKNWDKVKAAAVTCWEWIKSVWSMAASWLNTNVIQPIVQFFTGMWEKVKAVFSTIASWVDLNVIQPVKNFFQNFYYFVVGLFTIIKEWIISIWTPIAAWVNTNVIQPVVTFFTGLWNKITAIVQAVWSTICAVWGLISGWVSTNIVTPVVTFFTNLWTKLTEIVSNVWNTICNIWGQISGWVDSNIIQPIANFFSGLWDGITSGVNSVKETITGAFQSAWDTVVGIWEGITGFFSRLWDGVKGVVGKIIGKGKEATGNADPANNYRGGLISSPTLSWVGEKGAEMIIPLNNYKNRGVNLWEKAGQMLGVQPQVSLPRYAPGSSVSTSTVSSSETNTYSPQFTLNLSGTVDRTTERTVKKWIKEALQDTFDGMGRTNPRLTEV